MVRLESMTTKERQGYLLFQFLNGAIRILTAFYIQPYLLNFNSSMVRLEYTGGKILVPFNAISIPQWCD